MKTLTLILKKQWYDLIESGEKKEEYREIKEYWNKRFKRDGTLTKFDRVLFYMGYNKGRPSMSFMIDDVHIGPGKPEWGAKPGKDYYVISLGSKEK